MQSVCWTNSPELIETMAPQMLGRLLMMAWDCRSNTAKHIENNTKNRNNTAGMTASRAIKQKGHDGKIILNETLQQQLPTI